MISKFLNVEIEIYLSPYIFWSKDLSSEAKNLVSIVPSYLSEKQNNNVLLSESLGVMDMFEKYLESFEDLSDQKKIDLIEFGKEIITEYESENE